MLLLGWEGQTSGTSSRAGGWGARKQAQILTGPAASPSPLGRTVLIKCLVSRHTRCSHNSMRRQEPDFSNLTEECPVSLWKCAHHVSCEPQFKTTWHTTAHPAPGLQFKGGRNQAWGGCAAPGTLAIAGGNAKWCSPLWGQFLLRLNICSPQDTIPRYLPPERTPESTHTSPSTSVITAKPGAPQMPVSWRYTHRAPHRTQRQGGLAYG